MSNSAVQSRSLQRRLTQLESVAGSNADLLELMVVFVEPNGEFGSRECHSNRASDLFGRRV